MSTPMQLLLTPRMRAAFLHCKQTIREQDRLEEYRELQQVFQQPSSSSPPSSSSSSASSSASSSSTADEEPVRPALITVAQLRSLSRLYRSTLPSSSSSSADSSSTSSSPSSFTVAQLDADDSLVGNGYFHQLIRGSRPYVAPLPRKKRDAAFLAYLQQMRWKQEKREYKELVKDIKGNPSSDPEDHVRENFASASRDMGHGLNILTLMGTGFAVFYYAGTTLFPHNVVMQLMCGLLGLIGALMVEVGLFLAREQRSELETQNHKKMAKIAKERAAQQQAAQREGTRRELEKRYQQVTMQQQEQKLLPDETKLD